MTERKRPITAATRNWRLRGKMELCTSYQVQCWQTVFVFEIANFRRKASKN